MADKKEILVLIIDDDPIIRFIHKKLVLFVQEFNIQIREAENGLAAIDILRDISSRVRQTPVLILSDVDMPFMDGLTFLNELKNVPCHRNCEIVIATSCQNVLNERIARSRGVKYFFEKPLEINVLKNVLSNLGY